MPTIALPEALNVASPDEGGGAELNIDLTRNAWASTFSSGSPVNETTPGNFTNPSTASASRVPELDLAGGGTPGTYTITGTWNGSERVQTITTVVGDYVKASLPMDTITSITGPDPGADLNLYQGDAYADPPARAMWGGAGGVVAYYLYLQPYVLHTRTVAANQDHQRRVQQIDRANTAATGLVFVW